MIFLKENCEEFSWTQSDYVKFFLNNFKNYYVYSKLEFTHKRRKINLQGTFFSFSELLCFKRKEQDQFNIAFQNQTVRYFRKIEAPD